MCICIKHPETEEEFKHYYHLRWKILRAPWHQPEGSEIDDLEDDCFHIMAIKPNPDSNNINSDEILAVARLQFNTDKQAQIRYMAVDKSHERQGIGRQLINSMEKHAKDSGCKQIILDAREPAINFYKKLGYQVIEKTYLLFDDIQHYRMLKVLSGN